MQPRADVTSVEVTATELPEPRRGSASPLLRPKAWTVAVALIVGLLFMAVGYAAAMRPKPVYESRTIVQLHQPDVFVDPGTILKLNNLRRRYAALVPTEPIAGVVAEQHDVSQNRLARNTRVAVTLDALLIYPIVRWGDPDQVEELANALTDQLIKFANQEQTDDRIPADERIELRVIQAASDSSKVSPTRKRAAISGALLGLVGAAMAYIVLQYATQRRRVTS
jgi:capsular polysaccharide biosynthesis protein